MESMDGGSESKITSLKYKRAAVKRRVTNTLKKLDDSVEQYGRKAIIRGAYQTFRTHGRFVPTRTICTQTI